MSTFLVAHNVKEKLVSENAKLVEKISFKFAGTAGGFIVGVGLSVVGYVPND